MECAAASPRPRAAAPPGWPGDVDFIQAPDFSVLSTQDRRLLARSGAIPGVQLLSRCGERACHSCSRVMATRDWPAFEVIGELCGTVRVLAPPTAENGALEDGDVELCIDVPDGKAYEHGTNNTAGDSEAPTRLCIATRQAGTSNELAFIRTAAHSGSPNAGALNDGNSAPANANVAMVCTYLRGLPAALLVALCHIPAGQELLLNAGDHETHKSRGAPYCGVPRRTARKCAMAAEATPASVRPAHCAELDGGEWSDWCGMYKATGARPWVSTPTFACPAKQKAALKSVLVPGASVRPISVPLIADETRQVVARVHMLGHSASVFSNDLAGLPRSVCKEPILLCAQYGAFCYFLLRPAAHVLHSLQCRLARQIWRLLA